MIRAIRLWFTTMTCNRSSAVTPPVSVAPPMLDDKVLDSRPQR
jgi:hypothetical protein